MSSPAYDPAHPAAALGLATMTPAMAEAKNYYRWVADAVGPAVGRRVLDVGGGRGSLLRAFLDRESLVALDISPDAVAYLRESFRGEPKVEVLEGDVTAPSMVAELTSKGIDTILCTNVLEHVEADAAMLSAFAAILAPARGRLVLQVPAHAWLYGSLDHAAGHFRRYTRALVRQRLAAAGFCVERARYMNALAIPGWWVAGRLRRQGLEDESSNAQVRFYDRYLIPLARAVESIVPPPLGLSVLAIGRAGDG